mgnify:CR=1 FL=1
MEFLSDLLLASGAIAAGFYCFVLSRRLRRLPGLANMDSPSLALPATLGDDLLSAIETRSLWSRFGL